MNEILQSLGLSPDEIRVYEYLLTKGETTAGDVIRHTDIKRGTAYNILGDLVAKFFARQFEKEKVLHFAPEHPSQIIEALNRKREALDSSLSQFNSLLPNLISRYNLVSGKPAVRSLEGVEGLKKIYESVVNDDASEVLVIRSPLDEKILSKDYFDLYAKRRAERGIKTRIISNRDHTPELQRRDEEVNRERRVWKDLDIPSEIDIWGDKVAIISFQGSVIGTVIENMAIAKSFKRIFEKVWHALPLLPAREENPDKPKRFA